VANGSTGGSAHATLYGPFHRKRSPTQTDADARKQMSSGEIWGKPSIYSNQPSVKAYHGALPPHDHGIEFLTPVAPSPGSHPHDVFWYAGTPGVVLRRDNGNDFAVIAVTITRHA